MKHLFMRSISKMHSLFFALALLTSMQVSAQYCYPSFSSGCTSDDYIQSFSTTGGITNISNIGTACAVSSGISLYLSQVHTTVLGGTVGFTVVNTPNWQEGYMMWVDYNIDGDFTDAGENVWNGGLLNNGQTVSSSFTVPLSATPGTTRLRVMCVFVTTGFTPCGNQTFGEIEDYTFVINAPCSGAPDFYTVNAPTPVCPAKPFTVGLNGAPQTDLTYQWSYSDDYGSTWKSYTGTTVFGAFTDVITSDRMYKCLVTCLNSGLSFTTPAKLVKIAPFYYCYCDNAASVTTGLDIGNVSLTGLPDNSLRFSNGIATPSLSNSTAKNTYTTFQYPPTQPLVMYRDSSFTISVKEITSNATMPNSKVVVFVDFNRNGRFETNEKILNKAITAASTVQYTESATFTVPSGAEIGMTGMRVILGTGNLDSCGNVTGEGEVEDYLVDIRYEPCTNAANPGSIDASSMVLCPNYDYLLTDTTYEKKKSELMRTWQISADSLIWYSAGSVVNNDTLMRIFNGQPFFYRISQVCPRGKGDTTVTDAVHIKAKDGYKCYCYSQAIGGAKDTSDIGGFTLGSYVFNTGGPHLMNPLAHNKRTDHTDDEPIVLYTDSVYNVAVYQTEPSQTHGDAKVTIFMDFNNNKQYDVPYERVFTNYTSISNFTVADTFTVPPVVITGVPTGMRVIINNNIAPNDPSDLGCGVYTSGETHDYIVMFAKHFPTGIITAGNLVNDFGLFPNPTDGKFRVQFNSLQEIKDVTITVTGMTGQQVYQQSFTHGGGSFSKELDMTHVAKGVYSVELRADGQRLTQKLVIK